MKDEKIMRFVAIILALRAKYWNNKARENYDEVAMGAGIAYDNAFDLLRYAMAGEWDYLRQFSWSDEAEEILDRYDDALDLDTIKAIINQ